MADFLEGLASGANFMQSLTDSSRKTRAYNALRSAYGDIAGDPEAARQLQTYEQNQQAFPLAQQKARQDYDFAAQNQQGVLQEQSDEAAASQQALADKQTTSRKQAYLNGAMAVKSAIDAGRDPGATFDQVAGALQLPPEEAAKIRASIVANPASVDDLIAGLSKPDNTSERYQIITGPKGEVYRVPVTGRGAPETVHGITAGQPVLAQQRIGQGAQRLDPVAQETLRQAQQRGGALGKAEGEKAATDLPLSQTEQIKAETAMEQVDQSFTIANAALNNVSENATWWTSGPLSALPDWVNPAAAEQRARITTATSNIITDTVVELRKAAQATGGTGTGFGQITEKEIQILESRQGAILQASRPKALQKAVADLQRELDASNSRLRREYQKLQKARGQAPAAAGGGFKYLGKE